MGMRLIIALSAIRNTVGCPQSHLVPSRLWKRNGTSCVDLVERGGAGAGTGLGAKSGETNSDSGIKNTTNTNSTWGFCFDIDGVLLRYVRCLKNVGLFNVRKK